MFVTLEDDGKTPEVIFDSNVVGRISNSNLEQLIKNLRK